MKYRYLLASLVFMTAAFSSAQPPGPLAEGATLKKLADGFEFTEGLTCKANGDVYFTDQPNNRILRWTTSGELETFLEPAGRSNGMHFDSAGNLISCADEKNELWSIDPDGNITVLLGTHAGHALNGPNDVWVAPNQALYFTDPYYQRTWWDHQTSPQDSQQVYYLSPDHSTLKRVTGDLVKPNGIVGTPDGSRLYVADIEADRTYRYDIDPDGALSGKELFCKLGSDGMTMDTDENLYLTGHGVTVFDKSGRQIAHIDVPEDWVGNICFGGKDRKTLFIAASKGLYSIRTRLPGANPAK